MKTLPGRKHHDKPPSPVKVTKGFLPRAERLPLFKAIECGPWDRLIVPQYNLVAKRKTVTYYEGDEQAANAYMNKFGDKGIHAIPFADAPLELRTLRETLKQKFGFPFSLCYINFYKDETTQIGWHRDREEADSKFPLIMVTLGGTRPFSVWKIREGQPEADWELVTESGDLVEMPVGFHAPDGYKHAVLPQRRFAAPRMSLTFRNPDLSAAGPWGKSRFPGIYKPAFLSQEEIGSLTACVKNLKYGHARLRFPRKNGPKAGRRGSVTFCEGSLGQTRHAYKAGPVLGLDDAPAAIKNLRRRLSEFSGKDVNYIAVLEYPSGDVGMGWHNHTEDIGKDATVWIVSVGETRKLGIREKGKPDTATYVECRPGSLVVLTSEMNDTHEHSVLPMNKKVGARWGINCKSIAPQTQQPQVWDCHAGKKYPADAIYVGCRVRDRKGRVIREGTIFGNATDPMKSHHGWLKTEKAFREYAERKMQDPSFREQVEALRGKHLLCWCVQDGPKREKFCHARVWLELANESPTVPGRVAVETTTEDSSEPHADGQRD